MKNGLLKIVLVMVGIIAVTVGAGFALSTPAPAADTVVVLRTSGMTCGSCAAKIEGALKVVQGVDAVQVDVVRGMVLVAFNSQAAKADDLAAKISASGYNSTVATVLTMDQYLAVTGGGSTSGAKQAGCGGDCCNKNKQ